jgi:Flp pilus assembly protein TadD
MTHVLKGAELTREGKLFEATQLFNKALAVDEACADAYVGRGAAAAGNRNFSVALQDFDHAIELQPTHKNVIKNIKKK